MGEPGPTAFLSLDIGGVWTVQISSGPFLLPTIDAWQLERLFAFSP